MEWHLTPEYIINNWTDEEFTLMIKKLDKRKRESGQFDKKSKVVSDEQLFGMLGNKIKRTKK